ncbi:hypothetical protein [Algoriphagus aquimarinus]|uniref:Tetratricopeptide repeat protein n=1 Tax=Algoriphagus aquimarinus TaxID=237018 RepID=A0A1I1ABN2_9BACT|nr:hypothetical protein [Algoriphagus aquimarinus]SFB33890.1 hypothetical protein SAMN04489723_107230 [Algoriphagus aquimarinus]
MNSAQFLEILHKADSLDHRDIQQLQKVQENFPYFQIPYILTARYEYQQNVTENTYSLAYAAITSPDRIWLKSLIEKQKENNATTEEDVIEKREKEEEKKLVDETKEPTTLFRSISKKEVKLESIKEIEAKQHTENLAAGNTEIKYNLSAATMRITIVIDVEYINTSNDEETLKRPLTFFKDYDPRTTTFSAMEKELVDEIFTIIQDIFTAPVDNSYFTYIQAKRNIHVNAAQFLEIIQKSDPLDRSEILQLQKVQENFPYFQIPHILTARYEFQKDSTVKTPALGYAAITSPDRMWLKVLIEKAEEKTTPAKTTTSEVEVKTEAKSEPIPETIPKEEATPEVPEVVKPKPRRRKPPKDDLIETIKRKEKRVIVGEKKIEQIDLIKAFSKKDIKLATIKEIEANQNTENLAAASTQINDKLMSESYAKILAKQGKKQIAKEIYEKLVLKFPDKRTYFADLIEKLKD